MHFSIRAFILFTVPLAIFGCTSNTSDADATNAYAFSDFDVGRDQYIDLQGRVESLSTTLVDNLPPSGVATYDGMIGLFLPVDDNDVFGTVRLQANFDDNSLVGEAGSFYTSANQPTEGALTFSDGAIPTDDLVIPKIDIAGQIAFPIGTLTIDDEFSFRFVGDTGEYVTGDLAFTDAVSESGETFSTSMVWSAERQ